MGKNTSMKYLKQMNSLTNRYRYKLTLYLFNELIINQDKFLRYIN